MKVHVYLAAAELDEIMEIEDGLSAEEIERQAQEYVNGFIDWYWEVEEKQHDNTGEAESNPNCITPA